MHEPEVRCSSTLYAGTHRTLQREPPAKAAADPKDSNKGTSHGRQGAANRTEAGLVRLFLVMVHRITTAHVLLGASSERSTSSLSWDDPCNGARTFV